MKTIIITTLFFALNSFANYFPSKMRTLIPDMEIINEDINMILNEANIDDLKINVNVEHSSFVSKNIVLVNCKENEITLNVKSNTEEISSTIYYGIHKLGFLFPHPRIQVSPTKEELLSQCQKTYQWKPAFRFRGFHLHTLHPSEWVHGFLMGKTKMATDTIRWFARNMQNVFDLNLLRMKKKRKMFEKLKAPYKLAKDFGIHAGVSFGFALQQQKAYKLIGIVRSQTGWRAEKIIDQKMRALAKKIDVSFFTMEAGTSEFTSVNYQRAIDWMAVAGKVSEELGKPLYIKVHVSSNQNHPRFGNFNFLPRFNDPNVGVWPHTVMFYGLDEEVAPMYGNKNFKNILEFTKDEYQRRPTWYYPETSYFINLDIDVPLLLTDYMKIRAEDMKISHDLGLEGHINFTTGQEIGYWLMDWSVALFANSEYKFEPLIATKLLGEDQKVWKDILDFQHKYFKGEQLIQMITPANLQDEVTPKHGIHKRNLLRSFKKGKKRALLLKEISLLEEAKANVPSTRGVKNQELRILLNVTFKRIEHALHIRKALFYPKKSIERYFEIASAESIRLSATMDMQLIEENFDRYPGASIFKRHKNPTSYHYGYGYPARTLHFWKREEQQVLKDKYNPFFMNIYNVLRIAF